MAGFVDLDKHGLSNLRGRQAHQWTPSEMEAFLAVAAADDMALQINLPFSFATIQKLLALARCRGCGKCCIPNPNHKEWPGAGLYEDELKEIAKGALLPFSKLKQQCLGRDTVAGRKSYWLPFPCQFRSPKGCKVYQVRPAACRLYPFVCGDSDLSHLNLRVSCEYGQEIYRAYIRIIKDGIVNPGYLASGGKKSGPDDSEWDDLVAKLPKNG
jgi:Fe-S-cluster containining protein